MTDILGPASDNAVTVRPARTIARGASDTWFQDCTSQDAADGTAIGADFLNDVLAQARTALSSSGISRDGADDMLWRAMASVGVRFGADTGAANAIVVAFAPAPVLTLRDGMLLLVRLANDITGATTVKADAQDPYPLKWPDGTALAANDGKAGSHLLLSWDAPNSRFQLLCRMNGGGGVGGSANFVPGQIIMWPTEAAPAGTLECNGALVSRSIYARLFGIIGTKYGPGDGVNTFGLPNYSGEFLRGWDHGRGADPNAATRTDRGDGTTGDHVGTKEAAAVRAADLNGSAAEFDVTSITNSNGGATFHGTDDGGGSSTSGIVEGEGTGAFNEVSITKLNGTVSLTGGGSETRPRNVNILYCIAY